MCFPRIQQGEADDRAQSGALAGTAGNQGFLDGFLDQAESVLMSSVGGILGSFIVSADGIEVLLAHNAKGISVRRSGSFPDSGSLFVFFWHCLPLF